MRLYSKFDGPVHLYHGVADPCEIRFSFTCTPALACGLVVGALRFDAVESWHHESMICHPLLLASFEVLFIYLFLDWNFPKK